MRTVNPVMEREIIVILVLEMAMRWRNEKSRAEQHRKSFKDSKTSGIIKPVKRRGY